MNRVGRNLAIAATLYYGFMLNLFLVREVQGSTVSRFFRMAIVTYYAFMIVVYLDREVFAEPPSGEQSADTPDGEDQVTTTA